MIDKLELNHLRTLSALYEQRTVSAAAEALDVSQQAVSLQLKRIRAILGDPLFVRTGRGMVPTAYGQLIQPHVRQLLALIHAMPMPTSAPLEDIERSLAISATDHAQRIIVGDLVRELRRAAPRVKVKISNIESAGLVRRMQEGEIDVAFTSNGYVPEGLLSIPLFTERYVCVAARPLSEGRGELSLESLVAHDFLVVSPAVPGFDGSAGSWFEQQGLRRRVVVSVPSFFMALEYLRQTDMVAFMPSRLLPCDGLFEVPLEKHPPGFQVVAAYHPLAMSDPLLTWVLDHVRTRFGAASERRL
ncbi:LysR family transcriptional regulator [Caldimonas sp. KR1-144]|uniref:LysR family transcriptional regulator n=1 Tax=Caldimonas sp. KR1-144 TaxID=3400911 RepID=UPI003C0A44CF